MPDPLIEEYVKNFERGYYSFRFEYTDKKGDRRFETAVWNDGMAPEDALKLIARHVSQYKDGKITDFIDNQNFKTLLRTSLKEYGDKRVEELQTRAVIEKQ